MRLAQDNTDDKNASRVMGPIAAMPESRLMSLFLLQSSLQCDFEMNSIVSSMLLN